jgi:hypothetical protein
MCVRAELHHERERGRVVVVERDVLDAAVELPVIVTALTAKIVDLEATSVLLHEEALHLVHWIAVNSLSSLGWKAHSDDARSDVAEIQIEAVLLIS